MTSSSLCLLSLLPFLSQCLFLYDSLVQVVFYEYDLSTMNSIVHISSDSILIKQNDYLYPIQYGKMWPYMRQHGWENERMTAENVTLVFEDAFFAQHLFFRIDNNLPNPPDSNMPYWDPASNLQVIYKRGANVFSIFQECSSQETDENYQTYAGLVYTRIIPAEAHGFIQERFQTIESLLPQISSDSSTLSLLSSQLSAIFSWYSTSGMVQFSASEPYDNVQDLPYLSLPFACAPLRPGEVLYAVTDESFQLFLDEREPTTAFLVDQGSMLLANGLEQAICQGHGVKKMYLIPTHFHLEHIVGLASLINRTENVEFTLVISTSLSIDLVGWLVANYAHLESKISQGQLRFLFPDHSTWLSLGSYQVLLVNTYYFQDNRVRHVTTNVSPVFKDPNGNFKMFAGDLQSPSSYYIDPSEFFSIMKSCFRQFLEVGGAQAGSHVDFYFGVGMLFWELRLYAYEFAEEYEHLVPVREFYEEMYEEFEGQVVLDIRPIHWVQPGYFNMVRHQSYSRRPGQTF